LLNIYILSKKIYMYINYIYMEFKEFVLKYSSINSKFLNDFFNIIREDYIERYNEFLIDSEILRKWLKINNRQMFLIQ
jgi:hypothetical protein